MIPMATTQLHHFSEKAAIEKVQINHKGCVTIKLYLQKQVVSWIWLRAILYQPTPVLNNY